MTTSYIIFKFSIIIKAFQLNSAFYKYFTKIPSRTNISDMKLAHTSTREKVRGTLTELCLHRIPSETAVKASSSHTLEVDRLCLPAQVPVEYVHIEPSSTTSFKAPEFHLNSPTSVLAWRCSQIIRCFRWKMCWRIMMRSS